MGQLAKSALVQFAEFVRACNPWKISTQNPNSSKFIINLVSIVTGSELFKQSNYRMMLMQETIPSNACLIQGHNGSFSSLLFSLPAGATDLNSKHTDNTMTGYPCKKSFF